MEVVGMEARTEFREPGTGLLQIRPWGASHLVMEIAGLDVQGLEMAARLFPKRTGLLVPDWSKFDSKRINRIRLVRDKQSKQSTLTPECQHFISCYVCV